MTVGIIDLHTEAVLALLAGAPPASPFEPLIIYDGEVPDPPDGPADLYCLVYFSFRAGEPTGSDGRSDRNVLTIITHSVSGNARTPGTARSARIVSQRVRGTLLDAKPTIAGFSPWPIRQDDSPPVRRDETAGPKVFDQVDVWRLETVPG